MDTSAFEEDDTWSWVHVRPTTAPLSSDPKQDRPSNPGNGEPAGGKASPGQGPKRRYPPRTCRICLETVQPTFQPPASSLPGIISPSPAVVYISSDPASGRLIRPCNCRGSSRYVHEGCLQAWRHADPAYGKRNYWQCPTCRFRYRLERMRWAAWISSTATQFVLTISILMFTMFLLGFIADPIINLYLDPYTTISSVPFSKRSLKPEAFFPDDEPPTWIEHFLKGLASLGLLSFVKVLFAMSPWQWWNLRSSGLLHAPGRTGGGSGRDRLASISWIVVMIGVGTFLWVGHPSG